MQFINRHLELARLDRVAALESAGLIVCYGRRRIGKTRLLLEWANKHNGVYWVADESASAVQRSYFAERLEQFLPGFSHVTYPDWTSLLSRLAREAALLQWRGPIVIDELPYLVLAAPEFASVFQRFIDHESKAAKLIIAIAGSSQKMMHDAVLSASSPLYGRAKEIIPVVPMAPKYIQKALSLPDANAAVEAYTAFGGVPLYWEWASELKGSIISRVETLVLDPLGLLHDEPNRLLMQELPSAISLRPILDAIGLGAHRLVEISGRLSQAATSLSRPIARLQELELVEREVPFPGGGTESKRALYKIKDPFLRLWFDVVAPRRGMLAQMSAEQREAWLVKKFPALASKTWEDLCRKAVPLLSNKLHAEYGVAGRYWHGKGPEWDIVATAIENRSLLIGEVKWLAKKPSSLQISEILKSLIAKGVPPVPFNRAKPIVYALFINHAIDDYKSPNNVVLINTNDVLDSLER